jgi:hypothetical protein
MTMISDIPNSRCDLVVEGLRTEFGAILATRILEAEAADCSISMSDSATTMTSGSCRGWRS